MCLTQPGAWRCKGTSFTTEWASGSFEHHYGGITTKKSGLTFANGLSDHDTQNCDCVVWMKVIWSRILTKKRNLTDLHKVTCFFTEHLKLQQSQPDSQRLCQRVRIWARLNTSAFFFHTLPVFLFLKFTPHYSFTMVVGKMKFTFQKRVKLAQGLWLLSWMATLGGAVTFTLGCFLKTELRRRGEVSI